MNRLWAAAPVLALLAACTSPADEPAASPTPSPSRVSEFVFPGVDWVRTDPSAAGFDPAGLEAADRAVQRDDTACFVVVKDGAVVHESYGPGLDANTTRAVFSVTKSFTSVLVGIAADAGLIDLDAPAADHVPAWRGTPAAAVTVRDLLANVSGRHWDYRTDYEKMAFAESDKTAFAIGLEQDDPPGTVWNYNNSAIQTLSQVLRDATGMEPAAYARQVLLAPLQMQHTIWGADRSGHSTTFAGITSSCLDLARLGYLMMRGGEWKGQQVVSRSYVEAATSSSSKLNAAYGLLWWVNDEGTVRGALPAIEGAPDAYSEPTRTGRLAPSAPEDAFWALGFGRQIIAVLPSEGVVAVRVGAMPKDRGLQPDEFTALVTDALR